MKRTITILSVLVCFIANSQCKKGDCDDGYGTYFGERPYNFKYEGNFDGKLAEGEGTIEYLDFGHKYVGYFTMMEIDSTKEGVFTYKNGNYLKGFVREIIENNSITWELNGKGEMKVITENGSIIYKGDFKNNILDDENGEITYPTGNIYTGGVVDGKPQGIGKLITPSGGVQNDGSWYEGKWVDRNEKNPYAVPISYDGSSIMIDVSFDGTEIQMILDTGASITSINRIQFYSLIGLKKIFIENEQDGSFTIANGEVIPGRIYTIKKMKIGTYFIENVPISVINEDAAPNLLGLDALLKAAPSESFSINVKKEELSFY